jgi:hypothetical protein
MQVLFLPQFWWWIIAQMIADNIATETKKWSR